MIKKISFFIIASILFFNSCSSQQSCADENPGYFDTVEEFLSDWDAMNKELRSEMLYSIRSLPFNVTTELTDTFEEFQTIQVPECANGAHSLLVLSMQGEVLGYFNFLRGDKEEEVEQVFSDAKAVRESFNESWESLK